MSKIYFFNTLTHKKEEFKPLNPSNVGMYTCGPTVYNFVHIGNLRAYVFYDTLKRVLLANGYKVNHVMNITDVDDKIIKGAAEQRLEIGEFSKKYTEAFFEDLKKLNILTATAYPHATEYIPQIVELISKLLDKGVAYKAQDGSVYFSISKFPNYGRLSGLEKRELKSGTRVLSDSYEKDNVQDFALWKAAKPGEPSWNAPFGAGRPGWHIECSAMAMSLIGETLDIHAGGVDLIFPHHENEIAQSEAATGKKFVNYWVHNEHLLVDNSKMSKSLHNFYTLSDLEEKNIEPLALRYLYLTAHYRDKLNFTWESLKVAENALSKIKNQILNMKMTNDKLRIGKDNPFLKNFTEAVNNDLNTPQAIAVMWDMLKSDITDGEKYSLVLEFDKVLGLDLDETPKQEPIPQEVVALQKERDELRQKGDFDKADETRQKIESIGYNVKDTEQGTIVYKK